MGWLIFPDPTQMQRKSMKSKFFFPLNVHSGNHFESSALFHAKIHTCSHPLITVLSKTLEVSTSFHVHLIEMCNYLCLCLLFCCVSVISLINYQNIATVPEILLKHYHASSCDQSHVMHPFLSN